MIPHRRGLAGTNDEIKCERERETGKEKVEDVSGCNTDRPEEGTTSYSGLVLTLHSLLFSSVQRTVGWVR